MLKLAEASVPVQVHNHEVATEGRCEIDMRFNSLARMADQLTMCKYVVKNAARAHGKRAAFMRKPLFGDDASGMHVHWSLWNGGTNVFCDKAGYALLSETARYYIGSLLKRSPALLAFCARTTNSYRRLVPGYKAPVKLLYSRRNCNAAAHIRCTPTTPGARASSTAARMRRVTSI